MKTKDLHIVSFDVPYPADYGGVIDVYYRIRFLHKAGVKIHLHTYEYGRGEAEKLEQYCETVRYYQRNTSFAKQLSVLPFIVASRSNEQLLQDLQVDDAPILFEGLLSCYFINHPSLQGRQKTIRLHNVEHDYYSNLAQHEPKLWKKAFFSLEAGKLSRYEKNISYADKVVAISEGDYYYFKKLHPNTYYIPGSHPYSEISAKEGSGDYIFYHGNLSVPENVQSVHYILDEIAPQIPFKIIIAGKNPTAPLLAKIKTLQNVELYPNPTEDAMETLISNAHLHLIPAVQNTGLKLKLLYSLYAGRFIVTNPDMVDNTGLENLCLVRNDVKSTISTLHKLMKQPFTSVNIQNRIEGLEAFSTQTLQKQWGDVLFDE